MADRNGYLTFDAICPNTGKLVDVYVSIDRGKYMASKGSGAVYTLAHNVKWVLTHPSTIFEGIRSDNDESKIGEIGSFCYAGHPQYYYDTNGREKAPREDKIFLVFVNSDMVAYQWYWDSISADNPNWPDGHAIRFRNRVL